MTTTSDLAHGVLVRLGEDRTIHRHEVEIVSTVVGDGYFMAMCGEFAYTAEALPAGAGGVVCPICDSRYAAGVARARHATLTPGEIDELLDAAGIDRVFKEGPSAGAEMTLRDRLQALVAERDFWKDLANDSDE